MRRPSALLAAMVASLAVSCATAPAKAGLDDVQGLVGPRTGETVAWRQTSPPDPRVEEALQGLLTKRLTVDDAVQIALLGNRRLQATFEDLGIAQADLIQAGLLPNPVISAEIRFPPRPRPPFELDLLQNVLDLLTRPARRRIAESALDEAKFRVAHAVLELAMDTRVAFYSLQAALQTLEMRRSVIEATAASAEMARRIHEAGNNTDLDLANEQAASEDARLAAALAESEVAERRERVNVLLGLWGPNTAWQIEERLPEALPLTVSPERLESVAIANRLDLAAAREEVARAAQALGLSRDFRLLPELNVSGHLEREPEGTTTVGPSVQFQLPIFDQGQAEIAKAESELRRARQRFAALAIEIRSEVRSTYARIVSAQARARHYRNVVLPLRARIVERTQLQFNAMQLGVFELLQARQAEISAGADYVEALRDSWTLRAELEHALGTRIESTNPTPIESQNAGPASQPSERQGHVHEDMP